MKKEYEFDGYLSGDHDSFCWDVSREDCLRYNNFENFEDEDDEAFYCSYFNQGLFRLYISNLLDDELARDKKYKFKITIETEEIK